jgi:hypothetical protein
MMYFTQNEGQKEMGRAAAAIPQLPPQPSPPSGERSPDGNFPWRDSGDQYCLMTSSFITFQG